MNHDRDFTEVEIDRLVLDLPEEFGPEEPAADEVARAVLQRLQELLPEE